MRIDQLIWDDWNEDHISRHGVRPEEVEEAVFDRAARFFRAGKRALDRYLVLGLTEAGRYLFIVLEFQRGNQAYVITAREMTDEERKRFKAGR